MKKGILVLVTFYCFNSYSQTATKNLGKAEGYHPDTLLVLKQISLCDCIVNGFPKDSLGAKDPSVYVLMESIECSFDFLDAINTYTKRIVDSLPTTLKGQDRENTHNKRIMAGCIRMYSSKELDHFLRKSLIKYYK